MRKRASPLSNRINFDEFKSRRLPEKHAVAACNFGTISAFASRRRKTKNTYVEMAGLRTVRIHTGF
jgi:hypothetical protein